MIISVASGKGGTGKTLVATSFALSIKGKEKVRLLDCDVEEPNDHIFLKPDFTETVPVSIKTPEIIREKCNLCGKCAEVCAYNAIAVLPNNVMTFAELCHGCGACSYLCPQKAIKEVEREIGVINHGSAGGIDFFEGKLNVGETMPVPIIRKVKEHADYTGVVIVDVSPGTSCPVVESVKGSDFCLLVTEPTPFGFNDLQLAVATVRELDVPCGVIINRENKAGNDIEKYCREQKIPLMMSIPLDIEIARNYSRGMTLVEGMPEWKNKFFDLYSRILELLHERSSSLKR